MIQASGQRLRVLDPAWRVRRFDRQELVVVEADALPHDQSPGLDNP
jgi:hypothetical protein